MAIEGRSTRVVGFSQRLLPITDEERRIEAEPGVELRVMELWSADEIVRNASDAEILIVGAAEPLDRSVLARLPACRLIVRRGVGVDNVDVAAATELGIPVAFTPDASVEEVSDHALSLLLAIERRIGPLDRAIRAGDWRRDSTAIVDIRTPVRRLRNLTLGIVGLGRIGAALARKAEPLFARIIGSDPFVSAEDAAKAGIALLTFEEVLAKADLISIHAPGTPQTERMFNAAAFARMRPTTSIVNTSRGSLIDEAALVDALVSGRVAGAALDVTAAEPLPADDALLELPNVILTGHSAASSTSANVELRRRTVDAVVAGLHRELPASVVDRSVADRPTFRLSSTRH